MMGSQTKKLLIQTILVVCAVLLLDFQTSLLKFLSGLGWATLAHLVDILINVFAWISFGWLTLGLIQTFVWPNLEKSLGYPPPKLLRNIVSSMIILTIVLSISGFVFHFPISGLIAGSSVLAAVIGLAVTRMISDVFSGVALSLERAYNLGDWLEIDMRSRPGGSMVGKVVEINWRATRLHTKADEIVVIPNSELARTRFINFSIPERHYRAEVQVTLSHAVLPERAKRVLMAALLTTPGIMKKPEPEITLKKFDQRGVVWCLWFWVNDFSENSKVAKAVHENVLKHLQVAGLDLSYNRIDQRLLPPDEGDNNRPPAKAELLKRISFFAVMGEAHLAGIVQAMHRIEFSAGDFIVTQGEEGDSLFIIEEGLVNVLVKDAKGKDKWVAHIQPGGFFGEMALLTGEPRTASVQAETDVICYEVDKEILLPIFQEKPSLMEHISEVMAARKLQLGKAKKAGSERAEVERKESTSLLQKMRNFFGIKLW
ncbi:MAG: mechanosensitive ion channel family protein [Deltaproteobacteria bacterium]|nr:mechanosensitive ion channel family protein [Deltaproteobacteria bacterium]